MPEAGQQEAAHHHRKKTNIFIKKFSVAGKLAVLLSHSLRKGTAWHTLKVGISHGFVMIIKKNPREGR